MYAEKLCEFTFAFLFHLSNLINSFQKILLSRLIAHAVIGSIFGYLYLNVGTMATTVLGNYVYMYGSMLLVVYTGKMSVMMSCKYLQSTCNFPPIYNIEDNYIIGMCFAEIENPQFKGGARVKCGQTDYGDMNSQVRFVDRVFLQLAATVHTVKHFIEE